MKTHYYHANIVRYLDKQGNKSIIQIDDKYDKDGLLKEIHFNYIGVAGSSGQQATTIYNFESLTVNRNPKKFKGKLVETKEELKDFMLDYFNNGKRVQLICAKENCDDPNCKPQINIGNKIQKSDNTKRPYFSSNCNGMNYGESVEHLNAKIDIHKHLREKQTYYLKKQLKTQIENLEIERVFSYGNGQERRADVYYEKHYMNKNNEIVIEKFAIEVQRSNISYDELQERTQWYKNQNIAVIWIVVDSTFSSNSEIIEELSKKNFRLPLLSLISFSMKMNNNRFYIYDSKMKKVIPLTIQQENIEKLNDSPEVEQREFKSKFSTDNLYIISNNRENKNEKYYQLLSYKLNRNNLNIGLELTSFGIFEETKDPIPKIWDKLDGSYKYMHFRAIGENSVKNAISNEIQNTLNIKKFKI